MSSLFVCLSHTRYNSQILGAFYTQFIFNYEFMAIALSVNTQNNHGMIMVEKFVAIKSASSGANPIKLFTPQGGVK